MVADLADAALNLQAGGRRRDLSAVQSRAPVAFRDPGEIVARNYLRFSMRDKPGTLASVASILGRHQIGIDSVMQHEAPSPADYVPVIIVTGPAPEREMDAALAEIAATSGIVNQPAVRYRIEDFD